MEFAEATLRAEMVVEEAEELEAPFMSKRNQPLELAISPRMGDQVVSLQGREQVVELGEQAMSSSAEGVVRSNGEEAIFL